MLLVEIMNLLCYVRLIFIRSHQEMIGDIQVKISFLFRMIYVCSLVEFLDGNYLNSRRNDLITDDRLRVYVRVVLVDEKETATGDLLRHPHHPHHHHPSSILPPPPPTPQHPMQPQQPPPPPPPVQQQQTSTVPKTQASTSSSSASSSSVASNNHSNPSTASSTSPTNNSGLFTDEKERFRSLELLSNQIKILLDDERFSDVHIHVIPKQQNTSSQQSQQIVTDDHRKSYRIKHQRASYKQQQHPSCSSCHCTSEKTKLINNEQISDLHEQSTSGMKYLTFVLSWNHFRWIYFQLFVKIPNQIIWILVIHLQVLHQQHRQLVEQPVQQRLYCPVLLKVQHHHRPKAISRRRIVRHHQQNLHHQKSVHRLPCPPIPNVVHVLVIISIKTYLSIFINLI